MHSLELIFAAVAVAVFVASGENKKDRFMRKFVLIAIAIISLGMSAGNLSAGVNSARQVIRLDGTWQVAEGKMDLAPAEFEHTVPVPGLVSLAVPAFSDPPGPKVADRQKYAQKDPERDAFWYRRTFRLEQPSPAVALLKVRKAMYGTRVILNGQLLGDHQRSFTPGYFDAKPALKTGENELMIRVGADRDAVGPAIPSGFDFEKERYIPGIFDSVELILSGTPHFKQVQTAPDVVAQSVRVQAVVCNAGEPARTDMTFVVREAKSGRVAGRLRTKTLSLTNGAEMTVDVRIPVAHCHLWSPEDPFLYTLEADSGSDRLQTRFGMREFKFDSASCRALLSGKPYMLRGSNITLYRFFEDSECWDLPWRSEWVRLLHQRIKKMHWNCLRYCIGFPPEAWYDIADETGILIDDAFPIWSLAKETRRDELASEYAEWMRERWNHPCVVIWDANNETHSSETAPAIKQVRELDLSGRPWDNSYTAPQESGDMFESHPYQFFGSFRLRNLATAATVPQGNPVHNDGSHAVVINEYGWHWVNRDGTPTTLTRDLYRNALGENANPAQRFHMQATWLAAATEFWRHGQHAAAVMHFTALGYSRPDGQTCDHWKSGGVEKLEWEPEFYRYVRDAFAPVSVMLKAGADEYDAGAIQPFPVSVINDLAEDWTGQVQLRVLQGDRVVQEESQPCTVASLGKTELSFEVTLPSQPGSYQLEAAVLHPGQPPVRSVRDCSMLTAEERRTRQGIALGKPVRASSSVTVAGVNCAATYAVDGKFDTRWSCEFSDPQWLAVDLETPQRINRVVLDWEAACASAFSIDVSLDSKNWMQVYRTDKGRGGSEEVKFSPVEARWVRLNGTKRATPYGYSLWEMKVYPESRPGGF
jgi:beta-galactosidase